jgi:arginase
MSPLPRSGSLVIRVRPITGRSKVVSHHDPVVPTPLGGEGPDYAAGMYVIEAPYHLDEALSGALLPLPADETVRVPLARDGEVWDSLAVVFGAVARAVSRAVSARQVPVVVSGDCSTALGTVAGLQQADLDPAVVWFDAHGDVQTLETSASGYLGGLPVRMLTGYRPELLTGRLGLRPVPEHRIVLAGARDLDPPEVAYLERARIQCWEVARLTTGVLPSGPLYIHLDLDVLDPAEVDGLQFPVAGGLQTAQLAGALRMLAGTGRVAAVGVACTWRPGPGTGLRHPEVLTEVLQTLTE